MQVWCSCISPSISTSFNLHYLGLASSFHVPVLPPRPPPTLPLSPCGALFNWLHNREPPPPTPTPLPSGIPNLIYTDMFSQHRKQPVPLTKLRSSQRISRGAGLQGPIIEGLGSTTSSFERRKGDWWLQNADFFILPLSVRRLWTRPRAHLFTKWTNVLHYSFYMGFMCSFERC